MKGEVKERGMIFNDEMVRAILGGNKTQTRRIVEEKFYGRAVAAELLAIALSIWSTGRSYLGSRNLPGTWQSDGRRNAGLSRKRA